MSPASAEQVTTQIRTMMDRSWEYIALAYKGRAFAALGFPSWDAYVDSRLDGCRLCVPRERRSEAVASLADVQMSIRAIARLLGVGIGTVHRELANKQTPDVQPGTPDNQASDKTLGRDGKTYPRHRQPIQRLYPMCGEKHPIGTAECPWDRRSQEYRLDPEDIIPNFPNPQHQTEPNSSVHSAPFADLSDTRARGREPGDSQNQDAAQSSIATATKVVDAIQDLIEEGVQVNRRLDELREVLTTPDDAIWSIYSATVSGS